MNNQKGQATILIGVIFQVIFIFFAMVINVGLLVNDKINLQNSVDIAAYYAAMKQAEVLNTMGHINFQMRQAWKLLNWRLWVLGDVGRNANFDSIMAGSFQTGDGPIAGIDPNENYPTVCVRNQLWYDEHFKNGKPISPQNFCKKSNFSIPALKPFELGGFQSTPIFSFLRIFQQESVRNANMFESDCQSAGPRNLYYATSVLSSFKTAVAHRRIAMKKLQDYLISSNDMRDIAGQSIRETSEATLKRNLTLANREGGLEINFYNSLTSQPFLVPIELRTLISYVDIYKGKGNDCKGELRELNQNSLGHHDSFINKVEQIAHAITGSDYKKINPTSAQEFAQETPGQVLSDMISTIGFEKNPWVTAYVRVSARTAPRMLFSPIGDGRVQLVAEAYAMPFGGRLGPWYGNSWSVEEELSNSNSGKVDGLLPPRIGDGKPDRVGVSEPNYSRFPGDKLGMKSGLARTMGLRSVAAVNLNERPKLVDDDYGNILAQMEEGSLRQDPIVYRVNGSSKLRDAEILAIAPDLFDSAYFSVNESFYPELSTKTQGQFFSGPCTIGCDDLGTAIKGPASGKNLITVKEQIERGRAENTIYWKIVDPLHLRSGWGQRSADNYDRPNEVMGEKIGRAGYSVKIVSESYLRSPQTLGGAAAGPATIKNPPR